MKNVVFVDVETTGVKPRKDRIVELAIIHYDEAGKRTEYEQRFNPGVAIPQEASNIHGITNQLVNDCPKFADLAEEIYNRFFKGTKYFVAYNALFDFSMVQWEYYRAGYELESADITVLCPYKVFFKKEDKEPGSKKLVDAYKFYTGQELKNAHAALADILATEQIFVAQIKKYKELFATGLKAVSNYGLGDTCIFGKWFDVLEDGKVVFPFGKNKGLEPKDCRSYLQWILREGDLTVDEFLYITKTVGVK